ncbi:MAG: hypothetical protein QM692_03390 [Thermomicrobiales bacterium]
MDGTQFDDLVSRLAASGTRRRLVGALGLSALVVGGLHATSGDSEAGRGKKKKKKRKNKNKNQQTTPPTGPVLALGSTCSPGVSTCASGLACDTPTTRHSCSSTVEDVTTWCCVPPGGACKGCECCGDNYCGGDGKCIENPEG